MLDFTREVFAAYERNGGNVSATSRELGIKRDTVRHHRRIWEANSERGSKSFHSEGVKSHQLSADELIERRKNDYARKKESELSRKLVPIFIRDDGPIAITHMGDPHVDDDGCDIGALERHVKIINDTDCMFGANLGDLQNNWVGRLARLYGEQSTSASDAWTLTEWLVNSVQWIYLVAGNHDCWSGAGDPLRWMTRDQAGVFDAWGVRVGLKFPNGKEVRINARHDFAGHSQFNPVHGPMKAIQMGWRDHILTAGHKHTTFIAGPLKDPSSGILSWAIRCAGYKVFDRYAKELGLPDQNPSPSVVTVIDPRFNDDDARLVTVIADVEEGADYLNFKRRHWEGGRRK